MTSPVPAEREAFEAEFRPRYPHALCWEQAIGYPPGTPNNFELMAAWHAWQARSALAERPARFEKTYCSQCGGEFGPGNEGFSHCADHASPPTALTDAARDVLDSELGMLACTGSDAPAEDALGRLRDALAAAAPSRSPEAGEPDPALQYARSFAMELHRTCYPEVTQWKPLDDVLGLLTQIDNMVSGMTRGFVPHPATPMKRRPSWRALPPDDGERSYNAQGAPQEPDTVHWPVVMRYSGGKAHEGVYGRVWLKLNDDIGSEVEYVPATSGERDAALRKALHEAATSLETIGRLAGRGEYMTEADEVRAYADNRARVAREALAAGKDAALLADGGEG